MEKRVRNLRKEKGFTLIEVLFAITILAFGLLAVASMQTGAIQGNLFASGKTGAVTWAQDRMERLMALPYTPGLNSGTVPQDIYTISWAESNIAGLANAKLITVTVTYQERGIARQPVQLTCIKPQV